ncbi:MAG TPA: LytR C-terminal domain-containing protein [Actinocrinis sp.]|uniref:LytR C-terminal domain-containing protein n=1 Tax=Actinocrinis sp. TaxID=1920516 RepID=UPI002DDCDE56|nr:LytR C-terminal domain-containing protein [Actinocrinis sp.]HEV2345895.1 LytR C-terminal domain-containing protein [Actinocrinis sp.]
MSDERGWYGGERDPEGGEDKTEAYRAWQRQQQLQRPWDRQQPWQQESGPEPFADPRSRPGNAQQGPDTGQGGRGGAGHEDDFRPLYRRDQPGPGQPPIPPAQSPRPPQPPRPTPVPSPFQSQRSDGPPLPLRARHGGTPDDQEPSRPQRPELPPGPGAADPGRRGGAPGGDYGGPPTGGNLPRVGDPDRRGGPPPGAYGGPNTGGMPRVGDPGRRGPDMYSNEPPRSGAPRRDGADTGTFRPDRSGAGAPGAGGARPDGSRGETRTSRLEAGRAGRGPDGRVNRDIDLDEIGPRGRAGYGGGSGSGHGRTKPGGGSGNRGMLVVGGTVGVVVLALIAYFATRPSGDSTAAGTADATSSPTSITSPVPSGSAANTAPSTTKPSGAGASGSASSTAAPTSTSTVAVDIAKVHVAVYNGSGVNGRAAGIKSALVTQGFTLATVGGTATKTANTKVYYPADRSDSAAAVAKALAIPSPDVTESSTYSEVTVVIGTDWSSGNTYPAQ